MAAEALLGLKSADSLKGGETMEEASARAIAAVTTTAVSAAIAAAKEVAANATTAGLDYESAATAAAATTENFVAQAVAAEHAIVWEEERCPTMGSRFDTPSVGDGNEIIVEASAAVATAVENGYKSALRTDGGTPAKGVATGAAATANGNRNAA